MAKKTTNKKVQKNQKKAQVEKEVKVTGVVSFSQVSKISGISAKRLRSDARRKDVEVVLATDNFQGIDVESLPSVLEEAKKRKGRAVEKEPKIEVIKKDEVWFADVAQDLGLSKKQLTTRCQQSKVNVFNRCPEAVFGTHFARALKQKDAQFLQENYKAVDLKAVEKLIKSL